MYRHSALPLILLMTTSCAVELDGQPQDPSPPESTQAASVPLDARRSFAVTDQEILAPFTFKRVLELLVSQSKVPGLTAAQLFRQWWDTQNPAPGFTSGPHCDDQVSSTGSATFNAFPYSCRPWEGAQASATFDPFSDPATNPDAYIPIGLFNRFDLAPKNGSFCGEYRIVFAKRSGMTNQFQRNLIIFEGMLRNPQPQSKLSGCRKVADFWADLSKEDRIDKRTRALEKFYFEGLTGVSDPAVNVSAYGDNEKGFGQIRVNAFMNPTSATSAQVPWTLREFKLYRTGCNATGTACTAMTIVPATVKSNPFGGLFNPNAVDPNSPAFYPQAVAFQSNIGDIISPLLVDDLNQINMDIAESYNTAQSHASSSQENRYDVQLGAAASPLRAAIQAKLTALGSALTVDQTVRRAMTVSCAGCHRFNNTAPNNDLGAGLVWPPSLGFTHVAENAVEADMPTRFLISDALKQVFLPKRMQLLESFLATGKPNPQDPHTESDRPIKGGGRDE